MVKYWSGQGCGGGVEERRTGCAGQAYVSTDLGGFEMEPKQWRLGDPRCKPNQVPVRIDLRLSSPRLFPGLNAVPTCVQSRESQSSRREPYREPTKPQKSLSKLKLLPVMGGAVFFV